MIRLTTRKVGLKHPLFIRLHGTPLVGTSPIRFVFGSQFSRRLLPCALARQTISAGVSAPAGLILISASQSGIDRPKSGSCTGTQSHGHCEAPITETNDEQWSESRPHD